MKAKAVVFPDKLKVAFQEVETPDPGPEDVVIDTHFSWISNGTEGSFLRCERKNGECPWREGDPWPFPIAPGYQATGVIRSVGRAVTDLKPGQWVFSLFSGVRGMYEPWGGHVSPRVTNRSLVIPLRDSVPLIAASGLVLTQVGYNCGIRPPVNVGDTAVVIGDGLVGHWAAQTLHWRGASVIMVGKHDDRLAFFPEGGARHRVNTIKQNAVEAVGKIAPTGVAILVDTVGSVPSIMSLMPLMRHDGHIVSAGFNGEESMLDIQKLRYAELTLHSPSGMQMDRLTNTLSLIASGHLQTEPLITHRFPAEQAAEAWRLILDRKETVLGVVLTWS